MNNVHAGRVRIKCTSGNVWEAGVSVILSDGREMPLTCVNKFEIKADANTGKIETTLTILTGCAELEEILADGSVKVIKPGGFPTDATTGW